MQKYIVRRLLQTVPILFGITVFVFLIVHFTPGSPTGKMMDPNMTAAEKARIEEKFGLKKSLPEQYINWLGEVVRGNLGYSYKYGEPVKEVIQRHMWNTFYLALLALLLSLIVGIPVGILSATKQYSKLDYGFTVFALIGISIPSFFFGLLLIKIFAIDFKIFPISGMVTPGKDIVFPDIVPDILWHSILPAVVLGLGSAASFMRYTRSSMLEVIRQDYIRTARAKGLREKVVIYKHAFRNALIPIITLLGFWVPALFSGAVITEQVFGWPGMGKIGIMAVLDRDYPLILGVNLFLSFLTLIGNLLADIFYGVADPRIRYD
ncbi:ABC transporter permease [Caldisalinibacter kiritimatiensis]|uniref:Oligopeptide transport system permease protein OppB n=1 Tax=Caldisalinibacter kiritimatiensis TaxID=1304284 RepID=R1CNZ1_9FIRM|nr:ABC transporter permease [Caldisalinibacter kiritimatiensis]EOD00416.1 Oligopeptide transport system permease protein OppB [Caldisalinibacter kiritimatiensis]